MGENTYAGIIKLELRVSMLVTYMDGTEPASTAKDLGSIPDTGENFLP